MQAAQALSPAVRQASEVEASLTALEQIRPFLSVPPEPGYRPSEESYAHAPGRREGAAPRVRIEMRSVSLRHGGSHLPLALNDVSVTIEPAEKVCIVGVAGSGKSSMLMALARLVAPPLRSGRITVDGADIDELPILPYRASVSVVPAGPPTLFEGSIRSNLDPLGLHDSARLWQALQRVNLAHAVRSLEDMLEDQTGSPDRDHTNFGPGERQLLCIARALLSVPSVLLLDDATSHVDAETDALLQRTLRAELTGTSVLSVSSRVQTALAADKVLVLHEGRLVEVGAPSILLARRGGRFRAMVETSPDGVFRTV
jgi:ATP-binding cassette subfamily C (CFTR/MRP) protein 1